MSEPLENLYFNWLCAKVVDVRKKLPSQTYWELLKILHTTEFVWLISGDDNRAEDGKQLRAEFLIAADIPDDPIWRNEVPCSVLEMFVAFALRANFQTATPVKDWFWEFMDNLGLKRFDDANLNRYEIDEALEKLIWRTYNFNGQEGGMFPLRSAPSDQRDVEIWYQFCDYLVDHDLIA